MKRWLITTALGLGIAALMVFFSGVPSKDLTPQGQLRALDHWRVVDLHWETRQPLWGEWWKAHFTFKSKHRRGNENWILNHPEFGDNLAHGDRIAHVLDAFTSLTILEKAAPATLESQGLNPPFHRFELVSRKGHKMEIRLGTKSKEPSGRFAQFDGDTTVWVVDGAALGLIDHTRQLATLRFPRVTTWSTDDVDRVVVRNGADPIFQTRRQSGSWSEPKDNPTSMNDWIKRMVFMPIGLAQEMSFKLPPIKTITLTNRHGNATSVYLQKKGERYWVTSDDRPRMAFGILPPVVDRFVPPR